MAKTEKEIREIIKHWELSLKKSDDIAYKDLCKKQIINWKEELNVFI